MRNYPLVFRIQEPPEKVECQRDYTSCAGYGEMVTILGTLDNPSVDPKMCVDKVYNVLQTAQPGDFVLWAGGDPMSALIAGLVIGELGLTGLKWLRWDKRTDGNGTRTRHGYYTPVEFSI